MKHNKTKDIMQYTNYPTYEPTLMSINLIKLTTKKLNKQFEK